MTVETAQAVAWAEVAWGRDVRDVRRLRGGWTSTMLELTASDGARAVLRLMTRQPWRRHAAGLLGREARVQRQLEATRIPAPASIALDPEGVDAGIPAHLMSHLPGAVDLFRDDDDFLDRLAALLVTIHGHDPGPARPRGYQSWAPPEKRVVPGWARDGRTWLRAFELLEQGPPAYDGTFLHRDFHPGNVLWEAGEVSGVVDWVETSWGPARLDVAHTATNLAMLHGVQAAARFARSYHESRGIPVGSGVETRYWEVLDVVGYLPDPTKMVQPWRDLGREISDELARARLEQHLASLVP